MRMINSGTTKFNVALGRGMRAFKPWNWVRVLVAVPLLLTAALWAMAPQLGQAQGTAPAQPTGLAATAGVAQATLTWDDPSDSSITGYEYFLHAQVAKLIASDGAAGDNYGHSVAVDGDTAVVGAYSQDDSKGAAYVLTRQSGVWNQVAKLTDQNGGTADYFGYSVAVYGDTVVVGAHPDDENGVNSGAAFVFTKPATGWVTTSTSAKLTAFDGSTGDYFGYSVAVDGDTVVVGASRADGEANESGAAYVFSKPATGWVTTSTSAKLTSFDGSLGDHFGFSVAVDGNTLVVGAVDEGDTGVENGAAYVFTKPVAGWATTSTAAKLTASDGADNVFFGFSVAVDGDTVVVGAPQDDDGDDVNSGSAYVFIKPNGGWADATENAKLTSFDRAAFDFFGRSVAVDQDILVVSAIGDDDNGLASGSAYVFTKPTSGDWADAAETAKLTASDGGRFDYLGLSVAVDGDTVVVGAPHEDESGSDAGSAYVYEISDWTAIPDSAAGETNATSYAVTGLNNGTEYSIAVRAVSANGNGPVATVNATVLWPAPTNLEAGVDSGRIVLQWDTGDPGITHYLVRVEIAANSWDIGDKMVAASAKPKTTTSVSSLLSNGTEYSFTVYAAKFRDGYFEYWGPWSVDVIGALSSVNATPQVAVPATPTNLTPTPGDGRVRVAWDNLGNITIRKYQYSTDGGTTFNHMNRSNQNTTSFTFKNLDNGETYTLAIRASNLSGESAPATLTAIPGWPAPTNLVAAPDSGRIVLRWDTGDPGITHYLISSEITDGSGDSPPDQLVSAGSGPRTQAGVTSLTNGTEYTFTVQAAAVSGGQTVVAGLGASVNATPAVNVPATPTNLTATPGDGRVTVTWDHPGNITIRKYQYSTDGGTTFNHMNRSNQNTTSFTFKNLTNGTEYQLAIRASNLSGESAPATVTATPSE